MCSECNYYEESFLSFSFPLFVFFLNGDTSENDEFSDCKGKCGGGVYGGKGSSSGADIT